MPAVSPQLTYDPVISQQGAEDVFGYWKLVQASCVIERLNAEAALARIHMLDEQGHKVLGVDGFRDIPGGYIAALDLILDLSTMPMSIEESASRAQAFIRAHAAKGVTFEVISDAS